MSECEEMVGVEKNSVGYFYCDQKLIQDSGLFFRKANWSFEMCNMKLLISLQSAFQNQQLHSASFFKQVAQIYFAQRPIFSHISFNSKISTPVKQVCFLPFSINSFEQTWGYLRVPKNGCIFALL